MIVTDNFIFLIFGLLSVMYSCCSSLNNSLSVKVGAMFSWISFLVSSMLFLRGGLASVLISLSVIMIIMHLIQFMLYWNYSRRRTI